MAPVNKKDWLVEARADASTNLAQSPNEISKLPSLANAAKKPKRAVNAIIKSQIKNKAIKKSPYAAKKMPARVIIAISVTEDLVL